MNVDSFALACWGLLVAGLVLKMHLTSVAQFIDRKRAGRLPTPEDVATFGKFGFQAVGGPDTGLGTRSVAVWRNDVENIPGFVLAALALALLGGTGAPYAGLLAAYGLFRVAHSAAYLAGVQPWRSLAFLGAQLCQLGVIGWLVWRAAQGLG